MTTKKKSHWTYVLQIDIEQWAHQWTIFEIGYDGSNTNERPYNFIKIIKGTKWINWVSEWIREYWLDNQDYFIRID